MSEMEITRPPLRLELGTKDIKMTYGLEMDLRRLLPNAQTTLQLIMSDPYAQDYIIRRCLTDASKIITDQTDLIPAEEVTLTPDEVEALLMWVAEHVLYFFVKRANSMTTLGARYERLLPQKKPDLSTPSPSGSEDSLTTKPFAGLSE